MRRSAKGKRQGERQSDYWIGGVSGIPSGIGRWHARKNQWERSSNVSAQGSTKSHHWREDGALMVQLRSCLDGSDCCLISIPRDYLVKSDEGKHPTSFSTNDTGNILYLHNFGIEILYESAKESETERSPFRDVWRFGTQCIHAKRDNGDSLHVWFPDSTTYHQACDTTTITSPDSSEDDAMEIDGQKVVFSSISHSHVSDAADPHSQADSNITFQICKDLLESNKFSCVSSPR